VVAFEGGAIAVVPIAIGLHDHPLSRPEEVNESTLDDDVHLRQGNADLSAQRQEIHFGHRKSIRSTRVYLSSNAPEATPTLLASTRIKHASEFRPTQTAAAISCDQGALQLPVVKTSGNIKQGPLERGDWDSRHYCRVFDGQRARLMQKNPMWPLMATDTGYLDPPARTAEIPQVSSAAVRQHRSVAARKHRGHPLPIAPNATVAKSKHPSVQRD
jgi:hypothetical protein